MYELKALALLYAVGFDCADDYRQTVEKLFSENMENEELLYLVTESNIKNAVLHLVAEIESDNFDVETFGKCMMDKLSDYFDEIDITDFAHKIYEIWQLLPVKIKDDNPFQMMTYVDDPLSWGDKEQSIKLCKKMISYYNSKR